MHKPISLKNISLSFSHKNCFENFSAKIYPGNRIAIIGRNGSGKSSLINIICKKLSPSSGEVIIPDNICIGLVEQTISNLNDLSGGQRLNKRLSEALAKFPAILLLDEPTNHLDKNNRKSLMHMLKRYQGTLLIISHDTELLQNCINILWHIDDHKIHIFTGSYNDYIIQRKQKRSSIEKELASLKRNKKEAQAALTKEQQRAAKSKCKGKKKISQKKWLPMVGRTKASKAEHTSGKKKSAIDKRKQHLRKQLSDIRLPEIITPTFSLTTEHTSSNAILSIHDADIGYTKETVILKNINLSLSGNERIAICGKNASGKSTLLKSIINQDKMFTTGIWHAPHSEHIGYLDQHYSNLNPELSIIEHIQELRPEWNQVETRTHLNDFLFRKNEEVMQPTAHLSGGEKARASLSMIAAKTPRLLILDEITNNLDLETKEHVIQTLKEYPGAMIIISHEDGFLKAIGIDHMYTITNGKLHF